MLSRSAAERDIYIFVVQKILQNYNFSPGQELSHDYHQEEEGEEEEADPQLQLWNSWEEERPQGENNTMTQYIHTVPCCSLIGQ